LNRIRWIILIFGPLPIVGSSWALSAWFKSEPRTVVMHNSVMPARADEALPAARSRRATRGGNAGLEAVCGEAAKRLEGRLGSDCHVVVRPPFVLAGDLGRGELDALHERTILPAVRAMRNSYFDTEPSEPITVLVLRGEESYNRHCESLFGERGISIYGYYKPKLRTLVLNIATGNGTLLHELTHALVDFDFPDAPAWLNEGLASLHEQSRFRTGPGGPWIEGLVNWRLAGLQAVAKNGQLGSLAELLNNPQFRGAGEGTNYAQARYFCLYMQQQGVLAKFYRSFRRQFADNPRGQKALAEAFGNVEPSQLEEDFQRWVLSLKHPGQAG
jgi:hypothetical protein